MRIPDAVRRGLRERLWAAADALDWTKLEWYRKSAQYETWTRDAEVGGVLSNFLDHRRIRVYIKDTIMKGYVRARQACPNTPLNALGLDAGVPVVETYERPHGRRFNDGRVVAWGSAGEWKLVLTALHERSYDVPGAWPHAAVLMAASVGKFHQPQVRAMVEDAATKLGIERLVWLD